MQLRNVPLYQALKVRKLSRKIYQLRMDKKNHKYDYVYPYFFTIMIYFNNLLKPTNLFLYLT